MKFRGTPLIQEKPGDTGLAAIRNKPGWYAQANWGQLQVLRPYELYEQPDGTILAQNVLKKKFTLEQLGVSFWVLTSYQNKY